MAHAFRFYETGGPEVLRYEEVSVGEPGPGQVRLRHAAVGLNYADTYFRNGTYPIPMPNGLGVEAAGVVEALGEGVTNVTVGAGMIVEGLAAKAVTLGGKAEQYSEFEIELNALVRKHFPHWQALAIGKE